MFVQVVLQPGIGVEGPATDGAVELGFIVVVIVAGHSSLPIARRRRLVVLKRGHALLKGPYRFLDVLFFEQVCKDVPGFGRFGFRQRAAVLVIYDHFRMAKIVVQRITHEPPPAGGPAIWGVLVYLIKELT